MWGRSSTSPCRRLTENGCTGFTVALADYRSKQGDWSRGGVRYYLLTTSGGFGGAVCRFFCTSIIASLTPVMTDDSACIAVSAVI
jgi:hypothetical protein